MNSGQLDLAFLEESATSRARVQRSRRNAALAVPAVVTLIWLVFVTVAGHWGRVADHVVASITMVFGSFVAGSTPQGGGAVAFPVFTKLLDGLLHYLDGGLRLGCCRLPAVEHLSPSSRD